MTHAALTAYRDLDPFTRQHLITWCDANGYDYVDMLEALATYDAADRASAINDGWPALARHLDPAPIPYTCGITPRRY